MFWRGKRRRVKEETAPLNKPKQKTTTIRSNFVFSKQQNPFFWQLAVAAGDGIYSNDPSSQYPQYADLMEVQKSLQIRINIDCPLPQVVCLSKSR